METTPANRPVQKQQRTPEPEFVRVQDVQRIFGVKRGILYRWINEGRIQSVCVCDPGNKQGIRLVNLASVRTYIESRKESIEGN